MNSENKKIRVSDIALSLEEAGDLNASLKRLAAKKLGVHGSILEDLTVIRRSLDSRHRQPRWVYVIDMSMPTKLAESVLENGKAQAIKETVDTRWLLKKKPEGPRPVIVGAGPAGLLAALTLTEAGWPPLILERGAKVEDRAKHVSTLYARGQLNEDSNVCFGEGGAGTFSDGKLYTRVNDPRVDRVMRTFIENGADPDIRIDGRPHLGTDRLVGLLKNIRANLEAAGAIIRFDTALEDFEITDGILKAITLRDGERIEVGPTVLATGHSARNIWDRLLAAKLPLISRPFAVGFRVEHPQPMINRMRYGTAAALDVLPAADYRLTYNDKKGEGRGVYSFCMCPGGVVVPTPTQTGELCINGMSHASRSGRYANSALVVTVTPEDYSKAGFEGTLAGAQFQEYIEKKAFIAGGGAYTAPASRLTDYVDGKLSADLGQTSYRRGLLPSNLEELYPASINEALKRALGTFDRKLKGFVTEEATLIGVETRTSSPIRVPRGEDLQAEGAKQLYPAGEGMGFGGGIVSAAVDGIRAAEAILEQNGAIQTKT